MCKGPQGKFYLSRIALRRFMFHPALPQMDFIQLGYRYERKKGREAKGREGKGGKEGKEIVGYIAALH